MPKKASVQGKTLVCKGAGMIAGLEIWTTGGKSEGTTADANATAKSKSQFILVDQSGDNRFANDVQQWNSAASLNTPSPRKRKDAKKQNTTAPSSPHPDA
jgi:hypothetical protein